MGGRYGHDGMDTVDTLYANTRNNPIEDVESHVPLRVERYELREDACAPGQWRGGMGSIKELHYLSDGGTSVEADGFVYGAWGFDGGSTGIPGTLTLRTLDNKDIALPSKVPYRSVKAGERLITIGATGGGYGDPFRRDPQQVLEDVLDEYYTRDTARREYGVVITEEMQLDHEGTEQLRCQRKTGS